MDCEQQLAEAQAKIAELEKDVHNLNWALGTDGYQEMATPEEQAEHEAAFVVVKDRITEMAKRKAEYDALVRDAACWRRYCEANNSITITGDASMQKGPNA